MHRVISCNNFLLDSSNAIYSRLFLPDIQMKRNRVHILSRGSLQLELLQYKRQIQEPSDYYYYYLNGSPTQWAFLTMLHILHKQYSFHIINLAETSSRSPFPKSLWSLFCILGRTLSRKGRAILSHMSNLLTQITYSNKRPRRLLPHKEWRWLVI